MSTSIISTTKYTVGWRDPSYPDRVCIWGDSDGICIWGDRWDHVYFDTPGQAQWFLQQIVDNNSEEKIRRFCGGGPEFMFVVKVVSTGDGDGVRSFEKYKYVDHIIPESPL